jgi:hypothetical protein
MEFKKQKLRSQIKRMMVFMPLTKNLHRQAKRILLYLTIQRWIREFKVHDSKEKTDNILVCAVVTDFWIMDMIFYSLHLQAKGKEVTILINKAVFGKNFFLLHIIKKLKGIIKIHFYNSNLKVKTSKNFNIDEAKKAIINNICYKEKIENYDQIADDYNVLYEYFYNEYISTYLIMEKLLTSNKIQKVIVPSGFVYESASIYNYCKEAKINVITAETYGFKTAKRMLGYNEMAVKDFSALKNITINNRIEKYIANHIKFQEKPIKQLEKKTGHLAYQTTTCDKIPDNIKGIIENGKLNILIATTVTGDSSTIGVSSPFGEQSTWIKEVISFLSKIECNVFVRIHPIEKITKPKFQLHKCLDNHINEIGIENVCIIKPENPFNTFTLVKHVKFILTWVSTISADFVLRDKIVLLAAQAPFYKLGFCHYEKTKKKYFKKLNWLLNNNDKVCINQEVKNRAKLYIYFLFKNRVYTIDHSPGINPYDNFSLNNTNLDLEKLLDSIIAYK